MPKYQSTIDIIKKRRKLLHINQEDLSQIAGVSLRTLKAIESGKANPSLGKLFKILDALGLTLKTEVKS